MLDPSRSVFRTAGYTSTSLLHRSVLGAQLHGGSWMISGDLMATSKSPEEAVDERRHKVMSPGRAGDATPMAETRPVWIWYW